MRGRGGTRPGRTMARVSSPPRCETNTRAGLERLTRTAAGSSSLERRPAPCAISPSRAPCSDTSTARAFKAQVGASSCRLTLASLAAGEVAVTAQPGVMLSGADMRSIEHGDVDRLEHALASVAKEQFDSLRPSPVAIVLVLGPVTVRSDGRCAMRRHLADLRMCGSLVVDRGPVPLGPTRAVEPPPAAEWLALA
jgi:hypothetical protein